METTVTEKPPAPQRKAILLWGGIMGASLYILSTIGRLANLEGTTAWGIISFIISVGIFSTCMVMAVRTYRDKGLGGYISFGKAFSTSFLTGLFASLVVCLLTVIVLQFMGEQFNEEMEKQKMEKIAELEEDGVDEKTIEWTEKSFDFFTSTPVIVLMIIIIYAIASAIMGLIIGAIMKKEDPNNFGFPS